MSITEAEPGELVDVLEADAALDLVGRITARNRRVNVETGALADVDGRVLEPFAGTGRIHQLARPDLTTVGVSIRSPGQRHGDHGTARLDHEHVVTMMKGFD